MSYKASGGYKGDDDEGDDSVIVVSEESQRESKFSQLNLGNHSRNQPHFALDLSLAEPKSGNGNGSQYVGPDIQEKDILIVFDLPDGSQGEHNFKLGHTVEVLKSFIESEYGIPMMEQTLYLDMEHADGKRLDNPFSLLDYPDIKGRQKLLLEYFDPNIANFISGCEEVFVRVEGNLPNFSKK